ncbi:NAD(P)/FAD-dependent oxidoreductase [Amycolatopsis sp. EV170708-02-1]|uniref:NAD(P)/FAD-dependent oxidoreductase n=1 Tax=Amycolatopsis sp. EV170708-02-1 TaxID=2919322 RepID=UPI001F0CB901|nr:NAD(P)/FAD-dependent oxidoreductase [Amycolatopsis sp. EV170708-02-1]UMP00002.1 tryptophan 7-halogenase [Amycolatopsis sp. EV170708-02-1]
MPENDEVYDVVVIGGGPGGAMSGTLLADAGKRVLIIEAAKFPRYHIGESLLSGTADLLNRIGVLDRLESGGYVKKHGVEWVWGDNREPWTVYFKDALAMPYDYGYQVERAEFDKLLLDNAREHGVEVLEQTKVEDFALGGDAPSTVFMKDADGKQSTVRTRWILDASGQGGTVTKRLHRQEWDPYLKNLAVWSYWKGARRPPGLDAGNTFLPTFDEGWWWFIPLRDDITSVGMVVDSKVVHENRGQGMESYYADCLARTPELAERLAGAERTDEIHVARDWSYVYDRFSGDGYIAVGDAACFIDPLFSTGVHLAMLSGFLAAVAINTALDKPEIDRDEVLDFYESAYRKEFARLRAQVYFLYGGHGSSKDSYFWHARSQFEVPEVDPEKAFISLIAGAFQHRSWYSRYLERLDVPSDLRSTIEKIFDGKSTGIGVDPHRPITRAPDIGYVDDLAIDGAHLRRGRSIVTSSGMSVPLTPRLERLVELADGTKSSIELVDELAGTEIVDRDSAQSLVHEATSYGLLVPVT